MSAFVKFPSTPHLAMTDGVDIRKDKVMSEAERQTFLRQEIVVEEKVDGANLGISFDQEGTIRAQNRGAYLTLPGNGQWKKLETWLAPRAELLFSLLADRFILFGEWCYARHSIRYERLPDWFLGFDAYDRSAQKFLASRQRDLFLEKAGIIQVPKLASGCFSHAEIKKLFVQSRFSSQPAEGLYLRADTGEWLAGRAKLVRPTFVQAMEQHWSRSSLIPNRLHGGNDALVDAGGKTGI
jgi:ATP-dependent RNA circularization protein (DNA/RNA ligase family)